MAEAETIVSHVVQEEFFGDHGQVIRIKRDEKTANWGGFYFFIYPLIFTIGMIISAWIIFPGSIPAVLLVALIINGYFANRYIERNTEPAKLFELTKDKASLYILEDPPETVTTLPLNSDVTVDVVLNEATTSKEYGQLFGWTFECETGSIRVCANDDWQLWDIQALRDQIYKVIDHNDMTQGDNLLYYKEGLKGVRPFRRRGSSGPPPETPPTL